MVAVIRPPIITIASGFCDSDPTPVEIAAGSNPMAAMAAVITTGRIRTLTPSRMASTNGSFSRIFLVEFRYQDHAILDTYTK